MAELSIIVPIYNVEKYLPRCIESILAQTYTDFELILINDGSPDNCAKIMEQYAKLDNRIITIHQENKGVSAARNAGLKTATGTYIGFVDPDDWIEKNMYDKMVRALEDSASDVACCNWDFFDIQMHYKMHVVKNIPTIMCQEEFLRHYFDIPRTVGGTVTNKVLKKILIKELFDENLQIGEDALFSAKYCLNIDKAIFINESLYHVFERWDSATRKQKEKLALVLDVKRRLIDIAEKISNVARKDAERDYLDSCLLYYMNYMRNRDSQLYKMGEEHFVKYMSDNYRRVLFNQEIYWKTRILYLKKIICCIVRLKIWKR